MSVITKDLGGVTAYTYAVSKGYTGTEEEFATLMASYATVAEACEAAKEAAQEAQGKAEEAVGDAEAWATGGSSGTPSATNNAEYYSDQAAASATVAQNTTTMVAPVFDAATAYPAGAYVQHEGVLYILPNGHEANVTWANTTKDETNVTEDLAGLKSAINQSKAPVILDNASGEIVTVPDGADGMLVEQMVVGIEPVQDLHGQSNPYPAGGGKNLLNNTAKTTTNNDVTFTVNSDGTVSTSGTASGTAVLRIYQTFQTTSDLILSGCPSGGDFDYGYSIIAADTFGERIGNADIGNGSTITAENISEIAQIQIVVRNGTNVNGKVFKPMIRLASVTDSTYAPYSNLCPISGFTAAEVTRTGFNVWDGETESGYIYNGTTYASNDYWRTKNYIPVIGGATYYFKVQTGGQINLFDADKHFIGAVSNMYDSMGHIGTLPDNCRYVKFYQSASADPGATCVNISDPSRNGQYEPYTGRDEYTYPFPSEAGTVYGGTLTVNADGTGKLNVDRVFATKLFSDLAVVSADTPNSRYFVGKVFGNDVAVEETAIGANGSKRCNIAKYVWDNSTSHVHFYMGNEGSVNIILPNDMASSQEIQFCAKLVTPTVYTLTDLEVIELLKGVNNLWADCGNVTMQYPCDTKLFIERLTAPTEDDMIANANITSGKFFMVGNNLYISTSAIAQGETITPGTNCTAVSLADALNQINQ